MLHTIQTYIEKHKLISGNKPILVGFSGGADSVALLKILVRLGHHCIALHCNFNLRGEESIRDEQFSLQMAKSLNVPFYKTNFDTYEYASTNGISIEMAARDLRYQWFRKMMEETNAQSIATAHHSDDNAETLLMNLTRGSGIRGAAGIKPKNNQIIRPLLCVDKKQIIEWLADQKTPFVTDSSNHSDKYTRNYFRLNILPLLEKVNPSARHTLARSAEHLAAVEAIYLHFIEEAKQKIFDNKSFSINIPLLLSYPSAETILYEILSDFGFSRSVSENAFLAIGKESGKQFYSPTHILVTTNEKFQISIRIIDKKVVSYSIKTSEEFQKIPLGISAEHITIDEDFEITKNKNIAYLDLEKISFPLEIRQWRHGDWFIPFGMKGRKKISDYFTDQKYSLLEKEKQWILTDSNKILWIIGKRTDERSKISKDTKEVLKLRLNVNPF